LVDLLILLLAFLPLLFDVVQAIVAFLEVVYNVLAEFVDFWAVLDFWLDFGRLEQSLGPQEFLAVGGGEPFVEPTHSLGETLQVQRFAFLLQFEEQHFDHRQNVGVQTRDVDFICTDLAVLVPV